MLTWFLMLDLAETSYKQDKTSQTISLIVESNWYMTKRGLNIIEVKTSL